MKQRIQEVIDLIHQSIYLYYPKKILVYFGEIFAYLLSVGSLLLAIFVDDFLSKFDVIVIIADYIERTNGTPEQRAIQDSYDALKLALNLIFIFIGFVIFIYGRRIRKNRLFRSKVKRAEQKLEMMLEEFNQVFNELN